ncbi:hypothetical protein KUTeg_023374 [Tegillarca granosa]|uniref:ABC-2 type transporter transmembrane domain-containing protein n=1 Tax=Tegillarca granosa TaxID=220873 RepID=A0ABQ9E1H5_TEGGR|nr:hypothetical protein KUTeg_023374 [Tegillarca granosa]
MNGEHTHYNLHINQTNPGSIHLSLMDLDEINSGKDIIDNKQKWPTGFITQYTQLTIRTFKQSKSIIYNKFKLIETIVLCCLIFYMSMHWGFTPLFDTVPVPAERMVINKERSAGWYRLSAYYLAKMTSELPLILVQPVFFGTVVYWSVGLNGVSAYFATMGTLFIHSIAGQSIGLFLGIACMDIRRAMTLATVSIMFFMLLGGFYTRSLPFWLTWIKYTSFLHYTFHCLLYLEFYDGPPVQCAVITNTTESNFPSCQGNSSSIPGTEVLDFYHIDWEYWQYLMPLFIFIFLFRIAEWIC